MPRLFEANIRRDIENEISRLLDVLDLMGGDPDYEEDGSDEPSLGWTKTMAHGGSFDLEEAA